MTETECRTDEQIADRTALDKSIFGGKCKYCGGSVIINPGAELAREICASCGRPYIPETFGN